MKEGRERTALVERRKGVRRRMGSRQNGGERVHEVAKAVWRVRGRIREREDGRVRDVQMAWRANVPRMVEGRQAGRTG